DIRQRVLERRELTAAELMHDVGLRFVGQSSEYADQIIRLGPPRKTFEVSWQGLGVRLGLADFLNDHVRIVSQRNMGVFGWIRLRHFLRAVTQTHDASRRSLNERFGNRKEGVAMAVGSDRLRKVVVELLRDVARQLKMLLLIVPDRNVGGPIQE